MPIEGRFYAFEELQSLLSMTVIELKSYVEGWEQPFPGLFYAEDVEVAIFNFVSSHLSVKNYITSKAESKAKRDEFFFNYSYELLEISRREKETLSKS